MKKMIAFLVLIAATAILAGCGSTETVSSSHKSDDSASAVNAPMDLSAADAVDYLENDEPGYTDKFCGNLDDIIGAGGDTELAYTAFEAGAGQFDRYDSSEINFPSTRDVFDELVSDCGY